MKQFYMILANSLLASVTNNFVWFAVTFWVYLETRSVIATSIMAGIFSVTIAVTGFFLGSLVDRFPKKKVMLASSIGSTILYTIALGIAFSTPVEVLTNLTSVQLWAFVLLTLIGAMAGNLRSIAVKTLVTIMIPEDRRDKANGLVGTTDGISFLGASIFSGLAIGLLGLNWMLIIAIAVSVLVIVHLLTIDVPDVEGSGDESEEAAQARSKVDLRGTIRVIGLVPGLFGLIFFNTFNNFLGGVFMSLMDAYGLELVAVEIWGFLWGALSLGFIVGGMVVARKGLGKSPLRSLFLANIAMWITCILFPVWGSIYSLAIGVFIYLCLIPVVEAAEQTILQKVVPPERQGRVFGFAQSIELAATPITAFLVGPLAELIFIPLMTDGAGVDLIGSWFGTGKARGMALLFILTGFIGLIITLVAMRLPAYRSLSKQYKKSEEEEQEQEQEGTVRGKRSLAAAGD